MILRRSKKKRSVFDEVIALAKMDFAGKTEKIFLETVKSQIKFYETLPFGEELKKAFEALSLRIGYLFTINNEGYKALVLSNFMFNFYKVIFISIDKDLKQSEDIDLRQFKETFYKTENRKELKKVLGLFNCKTQNRYYEFSNNAVIELHARGEYARLTKFFQLKLKEVEEQKPKTSSLTDEDKSIKDYREIIKRILISRLKNGKEYSQDTNTVHIKAVAKDIGESYKKLDSRFYRWTTNKKHPERFRKYVVDELNKIRSREITVKAAEFVSSDNELKKLAESKGIRYKILNL